MPPGKSPTRGGLKTEKGEPDPFRPTPFQAEVFLRITPGGTTLITAPTGSGKTEAAFIPALHRFLASQTRSDPKGSPPGVRILLVCPLKALVEDLAARLERILGEHLRSEHPSLEFPQPGVTPLTGDTPGKKRQLFRKYPTPILVTTPESLARLLAHPDRKYFLQTIQTIIVDEWHALAANKRGADLSLSLARLSALCPMAPKRIGLSATIADPRFLASQLAEIPGDIQVLASRDRKNPDIEIHSIPPTGDWMGHVVQFLKDLCPSQTEKRNPILVFVQTRSLAERLSHKFLQTAPNLQVVPHHGSLSESLRRSALAKILSGSPDMILSTSSLELGMNIGSVRTVVLLDPPGEVMRLIQRIGRSGRGPNQTPKGILLIRHPNDLLEAGLSAALGMEHWLEPGGTVFPHPPTDILCQHLLGEAVAGPFSRRDALKWLSLSPYFPSPKEVYFQNAMDFLVGGNAEGPGLIPPRLKPVGDGYQIVSGRVTRMVLQSMGTILTDPLIPVEQESPNKTPPPQGEKGAEKQQFHSCIGYVDETCADTIKPGDRFLLAGKVWERSGGDFRRIIVKPHEGYPRNLSWRGNRPPKSGPLCAHLFSFRALAREKLLTGVDSLVDWLCGEMPLAPSDARKIADWLEQQERKSEIPDSTCVLVESVSTNDGQSRDYDIHLPFPVSLCSKLGQLLLFRIGNNRLEQPLTGISIAAENLGLRILDPENSIQKAVTKSGLSPIQCLQQFFGDSGWLQDLRSALLGTDLHRRKFQESAHLSLMVPAPAPNPSRRTRVGGRDWPARRLFDRVVSMDPPLLPMIQATNECLAMTEIQTLTTWFSNQGNLIWKCRELGSTSPFAKSWNLPSTQSGDERDEDLTLARLLEALGDA